MATKITELAERLGITTAELRKKLKELKFDVKSTARTIDDEIAGVVQSAYENAPKKADKSEKASKSSPVKAETTYASSQEEESSTETSHEAQEDEESEAPDTIEVYENVIEKELEREIVKSQRKKMAGKDGGRKDHGTQNVGPIIKDVVEIPEIISVKEFAEKTGLSAAKIIGELMKNGVLANSNG